MSYQYIKVNIEQAVAAISLNRPDVLNSFNRGMALEVQQVLDLAAKDESIRAVFLTGEGKAFCAGQDLAEAISDDGPELRTILKEHYNPIIRKLRELEKPVVCAVNGVAAGAGANIAFACDIIFSARSAGFIQAFTKIGLIPDSGGTYYLPRLIGFQRAAALMMLGDKVTAEEALAMGMIYKLADDDKVKEEAMSCALKLAKMPTKALGLTKRALNNSMDNDLNSQLDLEESLQTQAGETYDYREGVTAFLEKRKAEFKGK